MVDPEGAWTPASATTPWIASIGHTDHTPDRFFALLRRHEVRALVDVRSFPRSHVVDYNKEALAPACKAQGVASHHLAHLGGKRQVPCAQHMEGPAWTQAYVRLKEIALAARHDGGVAAFMCVERDPSECHRRFIAERLQRDGWRVRHILPDEAQTRLF